MTRLLAIGVSAAALLTASVANAAVVGLYDFEGPDALSDKQGNFGDLSLAGTASVGNGALTVTGSGTTSTGWAASNGGDYTGPNLVDKTMVAWFEINDFNALAGSVLTLDRASSDHFDALMMGEFNGPGSYQLGSSYGMRNNPSQYHSDTSTGVLQQMVFTFDDTDNVAGGLMLISGYFNGSLFTQYYTNNGSSHNAGDTEVIFGLRHGSIGGGPGALNATIFQAEIHDVALSGTEVSASYAAGIAPSPVPLPASLPLVLAGLGALGWAGRRKG